MIYATASEILWEVACNFLLLLHEVVLHSSMTIKISVPHLLGSTCWLEWVIMRVHNTMLKKLPLFAPIYDYFEQLSRTNGPPDCISENRPYFLLIVKNVISWCHFYSAHYISFSAIIAWMLFELDLSSCPCDFTGLGCFSENRPYFLLRI